MTFKRIPLAEDAPKDIAAAADTTAVVPLRVLLVEDSEFDAELLLEELRRGGYEPTWERVDTATALTAALERQPWDIVTCDWVMPRFSAPAALALLREHCADVPIIIVSGQVGEEFAVTAMKAGAHDFVSKHKLSRLCPAIERELKETQIRWEHKRAEKALAAAYEQLHLITDNMLDMLSFVSVDAVLQYVSSSHQRILGYAPEDLLGRRAFDFFHPEDVAPVTSAFEAGIKNQTTGRVEFRHRHADGHYVWLEVVGRPFFDDHGSVVGVIVNGRDITERKRIEAALRESEERFRLAMQGANDGLWDWNLRTDEVYYSPRWKAMLGYGEEELEPHVDTWKALTDPEELKPALALVHDLMDGHEKKYEVEFRMRHKDGHYVQILSRGFLVRDARGEAVRLVGTHVVSPSGSNWRRASVARCHYCWPHWSPRRTASSWLTWTATSPLTISASPTCGVSPLTCSREEMMRRP
jgi:PAS domain S-box-containing protein